jgi:DNA-binding MarR family transcriptional regulator
MEPDRANILIPDSHIARSLRDFPGEYDVDSIQVFHAVRALAQRMNDATSAWLAPFDLSAPRFNYLAVLYANRERGLSPNELGALVHTVSGTVTSMVDSLVRMGLAERNEHPTDGRSSVVFLTRKGERAFQTAARTHHANVSRAIAALSPAEAKRLLRLLVAVGNALPGRD